MRSSYKKIIALVILSTTLSACISPQSESSINNASRNSQQTSNQSKTRQVEDGKVVEYNPSTAPAQKANYQSAAEIYAELTINYATAGYLERSKVKLIKAQELSSEHDLDLAIVDYAAGYYYQTIGANSIAEKYYKQALDSHPDDFEAMNFYAQFLCKEQNDYKQAQDLFNKSIYMSNNDDMAQTLFLYSECMYQQGKKKDALLLMERANRFREDYKAAKLRLAEMYFEQKDYKEAYRVIYSMKDDSSFFNNRRVLELRLKLANYAHNKNEIAAVSLILSSNNYNDEDINKFFSAVDQGDINKNV